VELKNSKQAKPGNSEPEERRKSHMNVPPIEGFCYLCAL
jgi:hypothetical protein